MTETLYRFGNIELESPLINAAGLINGTEPLGIMRDVEELAATAIGAITVGSFTIPPQGGNAAKFGEPTFYYDPNTGLMVNSLGLPNVGIEVAETMVTIIQRAAGYKPVIFSVSPTLATPEIGGAVQQSRTLLERMYDAGAKIVELNVSCPNVVTEDGGRKPILGHDIGSMHDLFEMIIEDIDDDMMVGIKLPPYRTAEEIWSQQRIAKMLLDEPVDYITTSNTIPGGQPVDQQGKNRLTVPNGIGGMSGPATKTEGRAQLSSWKHLVGDTLPMISTLGVYDGEELFIRRSLGADAASMNTRLWNSTNIQATVTQVLAEFAEHDRVV